MDLEYAYDKGARALAPASRAHVKEALSAIVAVLQSVEKYFTGSELLFSGPRANWHGSYLLSELRLISRLRSERDKRIEANTATEDDLDWKKWH